MIINYFILKYQHQQVPPPMYGSCWDWLRAVTDSKPLSNQGVEQEAGFNVSHVSYQNLPLRCVYRDVPQASTLYRTTCGSPETSR